MDRRHFLRHAGLAVAGAAAGCDAGPGRGSSALPPRASGGDWDEARAQFALAADWVHMSALLIASHPRAVREAIDRHRRELDRNPVVYLQERNRPLREAARGAAAAYVGGRPEEVALTDSTTMGLGLVYTGLRLRRGQEILTTEHDYFVTHEATRLAADRAGASVRRVALYEDATAVSADALVEGLARALRPATRVLALTWVHSGTGLKLPLARIAEAVALANAGRADGDRVLLSVDAVHAFGVENLDVSALGVDFLVAGCHKWLFGPRGTGIVWARPEAWAACRPIIPSFIDDGTWGAWFRGEPPAGPTTAAAMTPGGFKAFEHQWAMTEAFEFHQDLGKERVAGRTHALAHRLKEGLAAMDHVTLRTPLDPERSAGIVCFEVDGLGAWETVQRLQERRVIATVTPYAARYARLTPSIRNTPAEVDRALDAIRALA